MHASLFGQFLLREGIVTEAELRDANRDMRLRNKSLGELAIDSNLLSPRQVAELNREQRTTDLRLGELAVSRGLLSEDELECLIILQKATQVSIGKVLVDRGLLDANTLADLEIQHCDESKLARKLCQDALLRLPQSENIQLCLNELIKGLQRICRQVVSVNSIQQEGRLQKKLPYIVLQKVSGPRPFHFGMAVPAEQVQRISSSLSGEPESEGFIPVAAMERFSDIVVKNACEKLKSEQFSYLAEKPKAFFIGDNLPAYKEMVGVHMLTDDGDFDAVFFSH